MTALARLFTSLIAAADSRVMAGHLRRLWSADPLLLGILIAIVALVAMFCLFAVAEVGDFLRDAGQQVGGAGGLGAAGAAGAGFGGGRTTGGGAGSSFGDRGFTYGGGDVHSGPSSDSPVVGDLPNGSRVLYTDTTIVDGDTWYRVNQPGGGSGWIPESQTYPTRPQNLPPPPPGIHLPDGRVVGRNPPSIPSNPEFPNQSGLATTSSAQTSGSRG
jgi:hypothetical protein